MLAITKDSIDLGLVSNDAARLVDFYRDGLGFEDLGESPMPGGSMHKLRIGTSILKVVQPKRTVDAVAPPGGIHAATGYRYWTIHVADAAAALAACEAAGARVAVPVTELRPGVSIAIVEDPDGNWVEFAQGA
jgi:glyoxylase I family protein